MCLPHGGALSLHFYLSVVTPDLVEFELYQQEGKRIVKQDRQVWQQLSESISSFSISLNDDDNDQSHNDDATISL